MRCQITNVKKSGYFFTLTLVPEGGKKCDSFTVTSGARYFLGAWVLYNGSSITGLA